MSVLFAAVLAVLPTSATGEERLDTLRDTLQRDFRLACDKSWDAAEPSVASQMLEDFLTGARATPAHWVRPDDPIVRLSYDPRGRPRGLGNGSRAHPDLTPDGLRFYLYDFEPARDQAHTIGSLREDEQESLWRRRAAVYLLARRAMRRNPWWRHAGFRRINGWKKDGRRAANIDYRGYQRPRGRESAELDLATFLETLIVTANSIRRGAVAHDDTTACQEHSKVRFVRRFVLGRESRRQLTRCDLFEAWLDAPTLDGFEIIEAEPSMIQPESMFGHLMLRIVRKGQLLAPTEVRVYQFVALHGDEPNASRFLIRGLVGAFPTALIPSSLDTVVQEKGVKEQRTLRRYRLHLTPLERRILMERIWEVERRHLYPYLFISRNCASLLSGLIGYAINSDGNDAGTVGVAATPRGILDHLASLHVDGSRSTPLLTLAPTQISSARERAERIFERAAHWERATLVSIPRVHEASLEEIWSDFQSRSAEARRGAYRRLQDLIETPSFVDHIADDRRKEPFLRRLEGQIELERFELDVRMSARRRPVAARRPVRIDDILEARRALYERELVPSSRAEVQATLVREIEGNAAAVDAFDAANVDTFSRALEVYGEAVDRLDPARETSAHDDGETGSAKRRIRYDNGRALGHGLVTELRGGARFWESTGATLGVTVSLFEDRLGSLARHSASPDTELIIIRPGVEVSMARSRFSLEALHVRLLGFATVRGLPWFERKADLDAFGWSTTLDVGYRPEGTGAFSSRGSLMATHLLLGRTNDHFVVVAAGLDVRTKIDEAGFGFSPGMSARAVGRVRISKTSVHQLRMQGDVSILPDLIQGGGHWSSELEARLEIDLGQTHLTPVAAGPHVVLGMSGDIASRRRPTNLELQMGLTIRL